MKHAIPTGWSAALLSECQDRCADFGDPSCLRVLPDCKPCHDCLRACGLEVPEPLDPEAAMRLLV